MYFLVKLNTNQNFCNSFEQNTVFTFPVQDISFLIYIYIPKLHEGSPLMFLFIYFFSFMVLFPNCEIKLNYLLSPCSPLSTHLPCSPSSADQHFTCNHFQTTLCSSSQHSMEWKERGSQDRLINHTGNFLKQGKEGKVREKRKIPHWKPDLHMSIQTGSRGGTTQNN